MNEVNIDHTKHGRVALLFTALLMGAALLGTGISGYLQATQNAELLIRSEVDGLIRGLRRELHGASNPDDTIRAFIDDNRESGLHYVALLDYSGQLLNAFGKPRRTFSVEMKSPARARPMMHPRPRPGLMGMTVFEDGLVHARFRMPGSGRRSTFHQASGAPLDSILIEATSQEGATMVNQALIALSIEVGAALLLLGATILFWRQSIKQEQMTLKMEQEKIAMVTALEADKRLKSLGRMSAVLGHELKNPIASLKGNAQLLLEKLSKDAGGYKQAETVVQEAVLLERLTMEILDYVRTGKLNYTKVYLDDLAESAVDLSGVSHVDIDVPDETRWILDRNRMEQVLVNLLTNARQSSAPDTPIELSLRVDAERQTLAISLRDRGKGIKEEDKEQLFEPFFTRRIQGTGLGLPLAKQIVESHGGKIEAKNHRDGGAIFEIVLPNHSIIE